MEKIFENFTVTVLRLNKLIQKIKLHEMQEYGLKAVHVMCGYFLSEHPEGLTASELVRLTLEDKGAISRALKTMREKELVVYSENGYNSPIFLTEKGKEFSAFIAERSAKAVNGASSFTNNEERDNFYKSLNSILQNLTNYYKSLNNE